jgi:hypothetical protein
VRTGTTTDSNSVIFDCERKIRITGTQLSAAADERRQQSLYFRNSFFLTKTLDDNFKLLNGNKVTVDESHHHVYDIFHFFV